MLMRVNAHLTEAILSRRGALLLPLFLTACKTEVTHQRVDPALAPLIPPDSTTLVGIRLDKIRKTPAWDKLFPEKGVSALDGLQTQTGMDLRTGMHEAVYCSGGRHQLVVIRGKFVDGGIANAGLEPLIKLPGAQKLPYKGFTLVGQEEAAVTFFNSSVALSGRASALRAAIDNRELKHSFPQTLLNMVDALPPEAHIYVVSTKPAFPERGIGGVTSLPLTLSKAHAYVDLRTGVALRAQAEGGSVDDAKKLLDGLRGLTSLLRLTLKGDQKGLSNVMDAMQFTQDGATVKLQADLSLDDLMKGLKSLDLLGPIRA